MDTLSLSVQRQGHCPLANCPELLPPAQPSPAQPCPALPSPLPASRSGARLVAAGICHDEVGVDGRVDGKDEAEGIEHDRDGHGSGGLGHPRPKGVCTWGAGRAGRQGGQGGQAGRQGGEGSVRRQHCDENWARTMHGQPSRPLSSTYQTGGRAGRQACSACHARRQLATPAAVQTQQLSNPSRQHPLPAAAHLPPA